MTLNCNKKTLILLAIIKKYDIIIKSKELLCQ